MKTKWLSVLAIAVSLFIAACGGGEEVAGNGDDNGGGGDASKGQELFNATCATCHGQDAENPSVGKNLRESEWIAAATDDEVIATITNGRPVFDDLNTTGSDMPAKGGNSALTAEDIVDIAAYIRSINEG